MTEKIVNIELTNGEGISIRVNVGSLNVPIQHRWYLPFRAENDDGTGEKLLDLVMMDPVVSAFILARGFIASVAVVESYPRAPQYCGLSLETGAKKAEMDGYETRVIMEDGKLRRMDQTVLKNRVNFWLAHGNIYRAEVF